MAEDDLDIWTVYDHPRDYPADYVARKFSGRTGQPTAEFVTSPSLAQLRWHLRSMGLTRLPRDASDDPKIIETWL